jgi:hypothetical protein
MLRVLEYYEGIVILTTNRITDIDIAVQSRVQLALRYNQLNESQTKQIWKIYLDQLNAGNTENKKEIEEWVKLKSENFYEATPQNLNGRQIRNIISSAQALARGEDRKLKLEDIQKVYDTTVAFLVDLWDHTDLARSKAEPNYQPFPRKH